MTPSLVPLVPRSVLWCAALVTAALGCGKVASPAQDAAVQDTGSIDTASPDASYSTRRWALRVSATEPGPLYGPRLTYHEGRKTVIMYGGTSTREQEPSAAMWELTATG